MNAYQTELSIIDDEATYTVDSSEWNNFITWNGSHLKNFLMFLLGAKNTTLTLWNQESGTVFHEETSEFYVSWHKE